MTIHTEPVGIPTDEFGSLLPSLSQSERVDHMTGLLNNRLGKSPDQQWIDQFTHQFLTLPQPCRRDVALTIRARGTTHEHALLDAVDANRDIFLFDSPGVFVIPGPSTAQGGFVGSVVGATDSRVILSSPTWEQASTELHNGVFGRSTVVLPETVTIAGEIQPSELSDRNKTVAITERNIGQMCELSERHPEASFIVGTPLYIEGSDQPVNAAIHVQNGRVMGFVFKYNGVAAERHFFTFPDDRQPYSVTGRDSVLICKDLLTLCNSLPQKDPDVRSRAHPKRYADPAKFVREDTDELLVVSCWGVGAESQTLGRREQEHIDRTYAKTISLTVGEVMQRMPSLRQTIISDRIAAFVQGSETHAVGARPHSMVAFRHFAPIN